ncbi:hypothetical protein [Microbulbifer sp. YPW1]|uniref:hypothetical protein n=1 Tax=Microbulbifer sp. YPW1 TaxID=2745199 RepID=UPI0015976623|nr:hypothetical protein [Microbulbifer sp. YPW1]QKX18086.1 hypothetical protein HUW35_14570 [Microbulbifer sp. YPW1]
MLSVEVLECIKEKILCSCVPAGSLVCVGVDEGVQGGCIREMGFENIYLVDASEVTCDRLKNRFEMVDNLHVLNKVVAATTGLHKFYRTNCSRFDSIRNPTIVSSLFPNLEALEAQSREAISLKDLIQEIPLFDEKANVLIVNVEGLGLEALRRLKEIDLLKFSLIAVPSFIEVFSPQERDALDLFLTQRSFYKRESRFDGAVSGMNLYSRDESAVVLRSLTSQNELLQQKNRLLNEQLGVLKHELDVRNSDVAKLVNQYDILTKEVRSGIENAVKQVEAYVAVQNYFADDCLPLSYHGWPISSDIAVNLIGKIEENKYDLIIEFGSGTSTVLFARILSRFSERTQDRCRNFKNNIVTFEHHETYYSKTLSGLKSEGLEQFVDLVYAPLELQEIGGESYSYYSCRESLDELSKRYRERRLSILVLVDGPPGATGPNARFPALPLLLEYLGGHNLDIVLDDYARKQEKQVVSMWKNYLSNNDIRYIEEEFQCEKGAYFCRVNS